MPEYEKLTVVNLREELVKRGLPKTGLKAVLVQRLQEADAQAERTEQSDDESTNGVREGGKEEEVTKEETVPAPSQKKEGTAPIINDAPQASESEAEVTHGVKDAGKDTIPNVEETTTGKEPSEEQSIAQSPVDLPRQESSSNEPIETSDAQQDLKSDAMLGVMSQPAHEPTHQVPTPDVAQIEQSAITSKAGSEELLEDSRKRKRRSQSPPPSSIETQKRLKADNINPHVELPEDTNTQTNAPVNDATPVNPTMSPDGTSQSDKKEESTEESDVPKENGTIEIKADDIEAPLPQQAAAPSVEQKNIESPVKQLSSDTRFKNLFPPASKPDAPSQQVQYPDTEDRIIGPAIHAATPALYIRELMRPLKPESVKEHLVALATPPDTPIDASIITDFFLDSIRTHCLVGFANISAASRVRSGFHDRVWPNERDRRPLFVDFIPEEKLKKWIDIEQNATGGRGLPQKRWEVVYEDEEGEIKAYLQEAGTNSGGIRAVQPAKADTDQGVQGAPSRPRKGENEPQAVPPRPDNGKGFQALDDLFSSTTAKPKLYYQPVSKATANRRIDMLAAGRGGGRNNEMRRYTFEDDLLVDKAPEFGNSGAGRGSYGGRGAFSSGYRGRGGGGYRGDNYRSRGDSWRDRRPGY